MNDFAREEVMPNEASGSRRLPKVYVVLVGRAYRPIESRVKGTDDVLRNCD